VSVIYLSQDSSVRQSYYIDKIKLGFALLGGKYPTFEVIRKQLIKDCLCKVLITAIEIIILKFVALLGESFIKFHNAPFKQYDVTF
jgi:hypothetical protein